MTQVGTDSGEDIKRISEPLPNELEKLNKLMEEMANASKEIIGRREPGEPCTYAGERKKR